MGLGVRSRGVVIGVAQVRSAAQRGRLAYVLVAPDASRHSLEKVVPMLQARRIRFAEGPPARELGAAVGRESTAAVGVVDGNLARGIREIVESGRTSAP
ncbi:MAG TPA: ribosomal L7Ae/L30e/S12e/Gadd45 family protein [Gemmatimonadaceae bacterium]|nr:ribosomal L7Ae/L30e/S12e/Gadd45 family protein [Gemmatimonadaceae bacterium]